LDATGAGAAAARGVRHHLLLLILIATDADARRAALALASRRVVAHAGRVRPLDVDDVDVRLEQGLNRPVARVNADGDGPEDAGDHDAVTGLGEVDELVVDAERNRVRRLTVGDGVGRLLEPDDLLVSERAAVVDEAH